MKKMIWTMLASLTLSSSLMATVVHSDGTNTDDWSVYTGEGEIESVDGAIHFDGNGLNTSYRLDTHADEKSTVLNWRMAHNGNPYAIYARIVTKDGIRHLRYRDQEQSPGLNDDGTYIRYELGAFDGWKEFTRNLEEDLKQYQPNNEFYRIERIYVRGDIVIDDIQSISGKDIEALLWETYSDNFFYPVPYIKTLQAQIDDHVIQFGIIGGSEISDTETDPLTIEGIYYFNETYNRLQKTDFEPFHPEGANDAYIELGSEKFHFSRDRLRISYIISSESNPSSTFQVEEFYHINGENLTHTARKHRSVGTWSNNLFQ